MHTLINADCLDYLNGNSQTWTTLFADPPDNIGLTDALHFVILP